MKTITKRWILVLLGMICISTLCIGCGRRSSSLKVGWVGTDVPGAISYQYKRFSGVERQSFRADAGASFVLDYDVDVEEGTLLLRLAAPDGETCWERTLNEDDQESLTVTLRQDGRYRLEIEGLETQGAFELDWEIE
jgi:hypothetical protein